MDKIKRNAFRCKKCGMVVESKSVHDYQKCECGNFTDGGLEYIRRGGNIEDMEDMSEPKAYFGKSEEKKEANTDAEMDKQFALRKSIASANADLTTALAHLETARKQESSRIISLAITKVEEAIMWLRKGE